MGQYTFPRNVQSQFLRQLELSTEFDVRRFAADPLVVKGARWSRFTVDCRHSRAVVCLGEHEELPNDAVITVSMDLRRLVFVWRLLGDYLLVQQLSRTLEQMGGRAL